MFSVFSAHGIGQTTRDSRKIQHDHGARSAKSTANMPFAVPGVDKSLKVLSVLIFTLETIVRVPSCLECLGNVGTFDSVGPIYRFLARVCARRQAPQSLRVGGQFGPSQFHDPALSSSGRTHGFTPISPLFSRLSARLPQSCLACATRDCFCQARMTRLAANNRVLEKPINVTGLLHRPEKSCSRPHARGARCSLQLRAALRNEGPSNRILAFACISPPWTCTVGVR